MSTDPETFDAAVDHLVASDGDLAEQVASHGRPVPFRRPATYATLVLLILEQQVSLDSAAAAYARLVDLVGVVEPSTVHALEGPLSARWASAGRRHAMPGNSPRGCSTVASISAPSPTSTTAPSGRR